MCNQMVRLSLPRQQHAQQYKKMSTKQNPTEEITHLETHAATLIAELEPVTQNNYPTPFKHCLFWPEIPKRNKLNKVKRKLTPTVATSDEFLNYQIRADEDKKKKLKNVKRRHNPTI